MYIKSSNQEKIELGFGNYTSNWGMHIAGLYETAKERDEILFGYIKLGLENSDLVLYCPEERKAEDFHEEFGDYCPACAEDLNDEDKIQISSAKQLYYPDGHFSPWYMDESLEKFYIQSQANGKRNVRATAEMVWALEAIPGKEHLMAYESRLNYFIKGKPWVSICLYNINKFDGKTIMNVLRTHPFTISKGSLFANPYFEDPDEWLSKNAPEFLRKGEA